MTDAAMALRHQHWRAAQQQLSRSQLRDLRAQWLAQSQDLALSNHRQLHQWLLLRCSLLVVPRRH